jgi:nucleoid DNA-binding protein
MVSRVTRDDLAREIQARVRAAFMARKGKPGGHVDFPSVAEARAVIDAVLERLSAAWVRGDGAELRGFGSFLVRKARARVGRNPLRPDEDISVPARRTVKFRVSKALLHRLQGGR